MLIAAYIVLGIAFGISGMLLFYRCSEAIPVRLSHGLMAALLVATVQTVLFLLGMTLGNLLRIELPDDPDAFRHANALVMLGLTIFVVLRQLLPFLRREPRLSLFNISAWKSVMAMAVATGINHFLVGLGAGFVASPATDLHKALWPLLILMFLLGYWGIMLGRQKVQLQPRRWMVVASILLLGVAIAAVVNA